MFCFVLHQGKMKGLVLGPKNMRFVSWPQEGYLVLGLQNKKTPLVGADL
jgi:hypothetical protein